MTKKRLKGKKDLVKADNLKFYVLNGDFNKGSVEYFNIFNSSKVHDSILELLADYTDYSTFREKLRSLFMWAFWSKAEYEILVKELFGDNEYKIDVFYQIEPNLDIIAHYILDTFNEGRKKPFVY